MKYIAHSKHREENIQMNSDYALDPESCKPLVDNVFKAKVNLQIHTIP